jgi:hypothetical protein
VCNVVAMGRWRLRSAEARPPCARLRHLPLALFLLVAGGLTFVLGAGAAAPATPLTTTATTAAKATSSAASLAFSPTSPVLVQTSDTTWRANVVVTISSTCPSTLSFWLVLPSTTTVPAHSVSQASPLCTTSNWQVLPETITFGPLPGPPALATLVVSQYGHTDVADPAGGVATTQITLQKLLPSVDGLPFGWVVVAAGGFALLFLLLALALEAGRNDGRHVALSAPVYASASWTFKDSWATNITAVGALVGTFLAASSSVASMFPGVPLYRFSIANATCGAIVIVVPLIVAVCGALTPTDPVLKPPTGNVVVSSLGAVLVGATLTMFAVGAELTLFGILIDVSAATGGWTVAFLILVAVAALVVLTYALLTTQRLNVASAKVALNLRARRPGAYTDVSSALTQSADSSLTL